MLLRSKVKKKCHSFIQIASNIHSRERDEKLTNARCFEIISPQTELAKKFLNIFK